MCKDAVEKFLMKAQTDWDLIDSLISKNILKEINYSGNTFYLKNIKTIASR
jgi:hypothetical protein